MVALEELKKDLETGIKLKTPEGVHNVINSILKSLALNFVQGETSHSVQLEDPDEEIIVEHVEGSDLFNVEGVERITKKTIYKGTGEYEGLL